MIESIAFQTKARTVDHLGREQIADCPTAISELWKNSYDAYARSVSLNVFDGEQPVASLFDDGHGMSRNEFVERWLVVGTESKATNKEIPISDRNGLRKRPKQGQKGIGRLSSANLGPLLLLVSKRQDEKFVAALVDWRLFENPYLNLSDIHIPITEFSQKEQLFEELPNLFHLLIENVKGGNEKDREKRIKEAWEVYDRNYLEDLHSSKVTSPSSAILKTIINTSFTERHISDWPVWKKEVEHGTALLISQINYDLRVQLNETVADAGASAAKDKFFETLASFVDPFVDPEQPDLNGRDPQFYYEVKVHKDNTEEVIVGTEKSFNRAMVEPMEHILDGTINDQGIFQGRIKAFGEWTEDNCIIEPPKDFNLPTRADTKVGPCDIFIASMEWIAENSTHSLAEQKYYKDLADKYSGFLVFRDGLRVLPYGRTDNDFFEIEYRRSKSAGREFWNHRQMFGRIAISRFRNPNLKDKAGREGVLDNVAAKALKALITNILMQAARRYFGSSSDLRKELLPQIKEDNKKAKAREDANKLRKKQRRQFKTKLKSHLKNLPTFVENVGATTSNITFSNEHDVQKAKELLDELKERAIGFRLPGAPSPLGSLEEDYQSYKHDVTYAYSLLNEFEDKIADALEEYAPQKPEEVLKSQLARNAAQIHKHTRAWKKQIEELQKHEFERSRSLLDDRNKLFRAEVTPLIDLVARDEMSFKEASELMEKTRDRIDEENTEIFEPYINALESLSESIDLEHLAVFGTEEANELRTELDRLNSLAQLGIAVEIMGHELQAYDDIIGAGLKKLPKNLTNTQAVKDIELGYNGLTDQLRFLSPLKLSGQKVEKWIKGEQIYQYVFEFFGPSFVKAKIDFKASDAFKNVQVFDQPSRLYPVFINLVNNSRYWLSNADEKNKQIILDVVGNKVVVSDNGPGVSKEDIDSLFTLFFTRKLRGGRGVGLYICRANLAAGGHKISYATTTNDMPLKGANFIIDFRGARYE